jgi:Fe2+ or Zn2+ uptake regulation protein
MPDTEERERLRAAGLRVTQQRATVLRALRDHPHATAEAVERAVREAGVPISTQAVYDVLGALDAAGLVRRIEPAGSPAVFETRVADNHHHLVCRSCGVIVDVAHVVGETPCLEPGQAANFVVDQAEVVFWGRCPDCQRAARGLHANS